MKLHVLNDLHLEFEDFDPPETDADVVVLAGDIDVGLEGLHWIEARFPDAPVIYVPGNHEFYHDDIALVDELRTRAPANIHVLDNAQVVIDEVRFLGSVLWTDYALFGDESRTLAMRKAQLGLTDFSVIRYQGRRFTPEDAFELHRASRDWLQASLAESFAGKTVVVTHHAPSRHSVHPRYTRDFLTPAFASDLEVMMDGDIVTLWVHGHMHESFDYHVNGTRVVCNPRGYAPMALNPVFKPDFVVQIH